MVTSWNDTEVVASVAGNAVSGIVRIQQNGIWSNTAQFTVPPSIGSQPSVTLSPAMLSLVVGEARTVQAQDATGTTLTGLTWSASDNTIVSLSTDDPPVIAALAAGHVTVTAGNASADITVYPGPSLPIGTVQWSNLGDGSGVYSIVPAVPSAEGVADVFAFQGSGSVEAVKSDGTVGWSANVDGFGTPDFQGGLVMATSTTIQKLDGLTGQPYPAYTLAQPTPQTASLAIHPDGTIFAVDGDSLVGINAKTGAPRFSVPMEHSTSESNTFGNSDEPPTVGQPIVAGDGYAYVSYSYLRSQQTETANSNIIHTELNLAVLRVGSNGDFLKIPIQHWTSDSSQVIVPRHFGYGVYWCDDVCQQYSYPSGTDRWRGCYFGPTSCLAHIVACTDVDFGCDSYDLVRTETGSPGYLSQPSLITNVDQGVLLSFQFNNPGYTTYELDASRYSASPPPRPVFVNVPDSHVVYLGSIGSDSGVNLATADLPPTQGPVQPVLQHADGTYTGTATLWAGNGIMVHFDQSGRLLWSQPGNYQPQMATADGGVIAQNENGAAITIDQNGNVTGQLGSLPIQSWIGNSYQLGSVDLISQLPISPAASFWAISGGNNSGNNTAILQAVAPGQQGDDLQVPPTDAFNLTTTYNAIELLTDKTPDFIFVNFLQTFDGCKKLNGNTAADVAILTQTGTVTALGQKITFILQGFSQLGQGPFDVLVNRFDPVSHTIAVATLRGHPLDGWRYFRVFSAGTNDVVVETGSLDRSHLGPLNYIGYYIVQNQLKIWKDDLRYIQTKLGARQGTNSQYNVVNGVKPYVRSYIEPRICEAASCN